MHVFRCPSPELTEGWEYIFYPKKLSPPSGSAAACRAKCPKEQRARRRPFHFEGTFLPAWQSVWRVWDKKINNRRWPPGKCDSLHVQLTLFNLLQYTELCRWETPQNVEWPSGWSSEVGSGGMFLSVVFLNYFIFLHFYSNFNFFFLNIIIFYIIVDFNLPARLISISNSEIFFRTSLQLV